MGTFTTPYGPFAGTSLQQLFDTMLTHLRTQGRATVNETNTGNKCMYRAPGGLKCAVGVVIPDSLYSVTFETTGTHDVLDTLGVTDTDYRNLLINAQAQMHDGPNRDNSQHGFDFLERVEVGAQAVARIHGLVYTPPTQSCEESKELVE